MNNEQKELLKAVVRAYTPTKVICDSSNNTPEDIENNILNISFEVPRSVPRIVIEALLPKIVLCYRCLHTYDIRKAPLTKTKRLRTKEPECPHCGCRVYFS